MTLEFFNPDQISMGAADKAVDYEKNFLFIEQLILIYEISNMCYEDGTI